MHDSYTLQSHESLDIIWRNHRILKSKQSSIDILYALSGACFICCQLSPPACLRWSPVLGPCLTAATAEILGSEYFLVPALGTGHTGLVLDTLPREPLAGQASLHADYHLIHLMNGPSLQNMTQSWLHTEFSLKFHRNIMNAILFQD